jgi:signal peptidase I
VSFTATLLGVSSGATGGRTLGFAVVRGPSMQPTLREGDRLLVRYGARPAPGAVVVVRYADGVLAIKRAIERRGHGWWVLGDAPAEDAPYAVDSRSWGEIPDGDVLAVALARVWPRPRTL